MSEIPIPQLVIVAVQAGLNLTWSHTYQDRFSHDVAYMRHVMRKPV